MPPLPPPHRCQVWIDFDGTITQRDLLDDLIVQWSADSSWREIERQWQAGEIGSRQCLGGQFALVRIGEAELEKFLDSVALDEGFIPLVKLLDRFDVPRAILSDGIDRFIRRTLARHHIEMTVRSNSIERRGLGMELQTPLQRQDCRSAAAHCKCGSMTELGHAGRASIYIGDGRSDLCPARRADFVFAKGALANALGSEKRPFFTFATLRDVEEELGRQWNGERNNPRIDTSGHP